MRIVWGTGLFWVTQGWHFPSHGRARRIRGCGHGKLLRCPVFLKELLYGRRRAACYLHIESCGRDGMYDQVKNCQGHVDK